MAIYRHQPGKPNQQVKALKGNHQNFIAAVLIANRQFELMVALCQSKR